MLRSPTPKPGSKQTNKQKNSGFYRLIMNSPEKKINGFENSIYNSLRKNKMKIGDVAWWYGR